MTHEPNYPSTPDVRDGLTHRERVVLTCLRQAQQELRGRSVPTVMLYGRVVEHVNMSVDELQRILQRFAGIHGASGYGSDVGEWDAEDDDSKNDERQRD